jgi:hypothetical protein
MLVLVIGGCAWGGETGGKDGNQGRASETHETPPVRTGFTRFPL